MPSLLDDFGLPILDDFELPFLDDPAYTARFLTDQAAAALTDESGGGLVVDIFASSLLTDQAGGAYKVPLTTEAGAPELTDQSGAALISQGESTLLDDFGLPILDDVGLPVLDAVADPQNPLAAEADSVITDESGVGLDFDVVTPTPLSARGWQIFYAMDLLPYETGGRGHLRASDLGYRTLPSDEGGVRVYPPALETAFEIDRLVGIDPGSANTATFGSIRLNNLRLQYDDYTVSRNSDSRSIQINVGLKSYDRARGIYVDPSYDSLATLFSGYAMPWQLSEEQLEIPLRDVTYWADRPIQKALYSGTGRDEGGPDLTGKPRPMVRGGTADAPVRNVPLVLVDAVKLIYQWTDGPGTIVALYEGGAPVFRYYGDVSDVFVGAGPPAGYYRTNNARGLLQMGSSPVNQLTADVTGAFPIAGFQITAGSIARYLLSETLGQPESTLDIASFTSSDMIGVGPLTTEADATLTDENDAPLEYDTDPRNPPYMAGFWVGTTDTRALDVLSLLAGSVGARLVPNRNGSLKFFLLRQTPSGTAPKALLTPQNLIDVKPQTLPKNLDPPTSVWKVGYALNNTVMTAGLNGAVSLARKAVLSSTYQYSIWNDPTVDAQYPSSNKPPPVETCLLLPVGAGDIADKLGRLFGTRAGYYTTEVPMDIAANLDIGDFIEVTWPLGRLRDGQIGQIVGEQIRSYDASATFTILVTNALL